MRRWSQVVLASVFINTSYGTLSYAFSVLVTEDAAGGDIGQQAIALGFALALLVSGVASVGVGTVADLFGTRRLLAGGAVVGAVGLWALAACEEPWQSTLVFVVLLGPAMAATFYEPVYVLMNGWFQAPERPRAYGVLTLLSGVSITIFTPLTQFLVEEVGWRQGTVILGVILLIVGLVVPPLLRPVRPEAEADGHLSPASFLRETMGGIRQTTPWFWVFTGAFFAGTVAFSGFSFHTIAQLETRGFEASDVARALAIAGLVSLPARFLLPMVAERFRASLLLAGCFAALGGAAWVAASATEWWEVWLYVGIYGTVFGAVYPLRALVTSERFAGAYFGRVIGLQALLVAAARALGPALVVLGGTSTDDYALAFQICGVTLVVAAVVVWASMRLKR